MVLTRSELIAALQKEVRILLHLAGKVDRTMLDYRPTPKQRSTVELLRYLTMMGPILVQYVISEKPDTAAWKDAAQAADARDFDQCLAAIAAHTDLYQQLLGDVPDAVFRAEVPSASGDKTSRGAMIVDLVLGGCAAYRTQLFLYLKTSGHEELTSANLWRGVDAQVAV